MQRRTVTDTLAGQFRDGPQMALVAGPRQVGKTTACLSVADADATGSSHAGVRYFNWDDEEARRTILAGSSAVAEAARLATLAERPPVLVFDELHKYPRWKSFLKGFHDVHRSRCRVIVTGSSRLDVHRRGGDSLMGRYFLHRLHPLSAGEIADPSPRDDPVSPPRRVRDADWTALLAHGGFPEPWTRRDPRFTARWTRLRRQQLVREDIRDLAGVEMLDQLDLMLQILDAESGGQAGLSRLAGEVRVSVDTARRWLALLESMHAGFRVRPWFRNVPRSLRKEPKWFARDWSALTDPGARAETFVACHLLKAVDVWTDAGLGTFELRYLRDKEKREVDFAVIRDGSPWFLVEVKRADERLSPSLAHFQRATGARHAFQVVLDAPFVAADAFSRTEPCVVPARTLLSQLP